MSSPTHDPSPAPSSFPDIPPFPTTVPTAPLLRISLTRLRACDPSKHQINNSTSESARLFAASRALGFFYLDLRGDAQGEQLLAEADGLFGVGEDLFTLGRGELAGKYDYSARGSYFGYKGVGMAYVEEEGRLDRNEFYNAGKDDFLQQSTSPLAHPQVLHDHAPLLRSYMHNSHSLATLLLTHITHHLDLPPGTLTALHDLHAPSGDHVRFIKSPPQPADDSRTAMGQHTDFGSVTILFNRIGGLQVLLPPSPSSPSSLSSSAGSDPSATNPANAAGSGEWHYIKPLPGHSIINLGDALVKFSAGLLRSALHRVIAPPGLQAACTRYALVYFVRPGDEVPLRRVVAGDRLEGSGEEGEEGEVLSSREHIRRRALGKRVGVRLEDVPA